MHFPSDSSVMLPRAFDPKRARDVMADIRGGVPMAAGHAALMDAVFGNSPYLARVARQMPETLDAILRDGPETVAAAAVRAALDTGMAENIEAAMRAQRLAKKQTALAIAMADIGGLWPLDRVTAALTDFADASVRGALRFSLRNALGADADQDAGALERDCGLTVLAMGKYGSFELNYSSDIDLIVFYDPARFALRKRGDAQSAAVDVVRSMVRIIGDATADGYVFRVDLRLRPDAGATQVAMSLDAAEIYYEAMGQNWERAAMIKARPCAGDPETSGVFMQMIAPFVWRRSLDFAAIEDIQSIKRQIHAHNGHSVIAVAGHNIKLGRGGIREIEFFVQTQQLILGGRDRSLRTRGTLESLRALRAAGHVGAGAAMQLAEAYVYLRTLEHRLQMIEDEQTHTVPKDADGIAHVACFMGCVDSAAFSAVLTGTLETVERHYARLFETQTDLSASGGNLVFTGVDNDPETLKSLATLGFKDTAHVADVIRGWHHGRLRATRSPRARELLTKLMPQLLTALGSAADPDQAFSQFDQFLSHLPAGVQLFSLFLAHPELLSLIAEIAGAAPRLATHLAQAPDTLDAILDSGFLQQLPSQDALEAMLGDLIARESGYEAGLDAVRRFAREQIFRVGTQVIDHRIGTHEAGPAFAAIADTIIRALVPLVQEELAGSVGRIRDGVFAVLALGKLGGREMTAASDLDLVFLYDAPPEALSDGPKQLPFSMYYARLAQRLIAALTSQTGAGGLYDVDMRLRPSGNKGPVAVSLKSFAEYNASEAWTWERMALTRARIVYASDAFAGRIGAVVEHTLTHAGDTARIVEDARDMRRRLAAQFPEKDSWDLKFAAGGMVDIEFIAQTLQLCAHNAASLDRSTIGALEKLRATGALSDADSEVLLASARLQQSLTQILRIALASPFSPETMTAGLRALLLRAGGCDSFDALTQTLAERQAATRAIFTRLIGA